MLVLNLTLYTINPSGFFSKYKSLLNLAYFDLNTLLLISLKTILFDPILSITVC